MAVLLSLPMAIDLKALALAGAQLRLHQIDAERRALVEHFPELVSRRGVTAPQKASTPAPPPRRKPMSAAARKAVSARMKRYWATRRAKGAKAEKS